MTIASNALAIGLTGAFGSGCTTSSEFLRTRLGYTRVQLSDVLRREWAARNNTEPKRNELQTLGNQLRSLSQDPGVLARTAVQDLDKSSDAHGRIVFDGIRNVGEIEALRQQFGFRFFLFAVDCDPGERWDRLMDAYKGRGLTEEDFGKDDMRDRREDDQYGQQVVPCMDKADVLIHNDQLVTPAELRRKVIEFSGLVSGDKLRYATSKEINMNVAYSSSHSSKCLKRQVGAVVVDESGTIVGTGCNENPSPTPPCVETPQYGADQALDRPGKCYRDIVKFDDLMKFAKQGRLCPICGNALSAPLSDRPPWLCGCGANLGDVCFPERVMTLCTAVHAEVAALYVAGTRARGATMYVTTLPCFQCTEQIIHAGIRSILFTEPYPDIRAAHRLRLAGITYDKFEGVRSFRFDEIFARVRPHAENRQ